MILALRTDSLTTEFILLEPGDKLVAHTFWESNRTLADLLLTRTEELLEANHQKLADVGGIIIYSGPGSFTSLRIGHSVANALADALNIKIVSAGGDDWYKSAEAKLAKVQVGRPVFPMYGSEPNITSSRRPS